MATQTSVLKLSFGYEDGTSRDLKLGSFKFSDTSGFKTNIKAFNQNKVDSLKDKLLSDDGAQLTGIVAAQLTTERITPINLYNKTNGGGN